jgi:maltose 6'-phosphate phosphatase
VVRDGGYEDQFKMAGGSSSRDVAPPLGNGEPTPATQRLDHVFLRAGSSLRAVAAREVFTDADYGRVSDHAGYLVEFEPL